MKYLIFGGSGFIGHHLLNFINKEKKSKAIVYDIKEPITKNVNFERVDVRENIYTRSLPAEESIIFNLAAVHRTPGHPSEEYFETNLLGAENICKYARKHDINTIVFTSSIATYGTYEEKKSENTTPMPDIPYGISKLTAEYIHLLWQQEYPQKRKLIIIRPGVVFGENENGNFTRLINSISQGTFFYPGRRDTIKACIYVKDLVDAMFQIVEKLEHGSNLYNFTYEPAPSIEKICNIISQKGQLKSPKIKFPSSVLLFISRILYALSKKEGIHPDRVRKLTISNNIDGTKLKKNFKLKYGLKRGILDWMNDTNFFEEKKIF
jgi:nucleoside-diphosphate-sugar epimerase